MWAEFVEFLNVKFGGTYSEFKAGVSSLGYVALDDICK